MTLPFLFRARSSVFFIVFCVAIAVFTDTFLYGLVIPVFPYSLIDRAGIPEAELQKWNSILLGLFGAGSVIGAPVIGWLTDRMLSRRWPFLFGLLLFLGATLMLWLAEHVLLLSIGRFAQGVATAICWTVGLALIADSVETDDVAQMTGYAGLALSVGYVTGPLIGGVVYEHLGYNAVFIIAVVIVVFDIAMRLAIIEKKEAVAILKDLQDVDDSREPLLPHSVPQESPDAKDPPESHGPAILTLLKSSRILAVVACTLTIAISMTALESTIPIFLKEVYFFTPTGVSLTFVVLVLPSFSAPLVGKLCKYVDLRYFISIGFLTTGCATMLMQVPVGRSKWNEIAMACLILVVGAAYPFVVTPIMGELSKVVQEIEERSPGIFGPMGGSGQAFGLFNSAFATGTIIGPLAGGFLKYRVSWQAMTIFLGVLDFAAGTLALMCIGGRLNFHRKEEVVTETEA